MNSINIIGRLTKAPEVKYVANDKCVCKFCLAVNRKFKNAQGQYDADFIPAEIWGKIAEIIGNSVGKGQRLAVSGELRVDKYQDAQGINKQRVFVAATSIDFIEPKDTKPADGGFAQMGEEVEF